MSNMQTYNGSTASFLRSKGIQVYTGPQARTSGSSNFDWTKVKGNKNPSPAVLAKRQLEQQRAQQYGVVYGGGQKVAPVSSSALLGQGGNPLSQQGNTKRKGGNIGEPSTQEDATYFSLYSIADEGGDVNGYADFIYDYEGRKSDLDTILADSQREALSTYLANPLSGSNLPPPPVFPSMVTNSYNGRKNQLNRSNSGTSLQKLSGKRSPKTTNYNWSNQQQYYPEEQFEEYQYYQN